MAKECDSKTCDKSSCEGCASKKNPQSMQAAMNAMSNVKRRGSVQWAVKAALDNPPHDSYLLQTEWQRKAIK
ncbi:MAG: hypothetical protein ACLU4P_03110 [Ruminococcus sp.]